MPSSMYTEVSGSVSASRRQESVVRRLLPTLVSLDVEPIEHNDVRAAARRIRSRAWCRVLVEEVAVAHLANPSARAAR